MLEEQEGRCALPSCGRTGQTRSLHLDHDHKTGHPRGMMCWRHNKGLQCFDDNPVLMQEAAYYLRLHDGAV